MFDIKKRYTFQTLVPAVLGNEFKLATYQGSFDLKTALKHEPNIVQKFRTIFPHLAVGYSDNPDSTIYHLFETTLSQTIVLADIWINKDTVVLNETVNIVVTLADVNVTDQTSIRTALLAAGFTAFNIEIK